MISKIESRAEHIYIKLSQVAHLDCKMFEGKDDTCFITVQSVASNVQLIAGTQYVFVNYELN